MQSKRELPFDFFLPTDRLLIEFDGAQHYVVSEHWGGTAKLAEAQRHDAIKDRFAQKVGFCLLRIPYWEIKSVEDLVLDAHSTHPTNVAQLYPEFRHQGISL